jgi:hypothetical protein
VQVRSSKTNCFSSPKTTTKPCGWSRLYTFRRISFYCGFSNKFIKTPRFGKYVSKSSTCLREKFSANVGADGVVGLTFVPAGKLS